jgi:phosphatidylglycerol lysyltransferase
MKKKVFHNLAPLIGVLLFALALWLLHRELKAYHYRDILHQLQQIPASRLFFALVLTILDYLVLTGYDVLALQYINQPLSYRRIALASFIGYVFSHNATMLGGSAARYRIYSAWEITAVDVAKIVVFCALGFWMGFVTIAGVVFVTEPLAISSFMHLHFISARPLGMILLGSIAAYLVFGILLARPLKIRRWDFTLPAPWISFSLIIISSLDWILAGSVLYVLLPPASSLAYLQFMGVFLLAQAAGLASYIPGGLGVFETVILFSLSPVHSVPTVMGCLLVYRAIYYLLPLCVASILLSVKEVLERRQAFKRVSIVLGRWASAVVPQVVAFTTFVSGAILLFSGALPLSEGRLSWLRDLLPLPVIEVSHFVGSLVGVGLLVLARGLQQRLDAAYHLAIVLLGSGIVFSLLRGFNYEEAVILLIMLVVLLPCHGEFYRRASLFRQRFSPAWSLAIAIVLLCSIWLGMFSYRHVDYSSSLWWRFALSGDAPRFLRAAVGTTALALFLAVATLLWSAAPVIELPTEMVLNKAYAIVEKSRRTYANLALLGDKSFLFSDSGNALIMYAIEGRSWIAMGDPLGSEEERSELIWRFREICDRYNSWPVFYEVEKEQLHFYVDLGLSSLKLGEEARVWLESFSLEGSVHKEFRYINRKFDNAGYKFEVIARNEVLSVFAELKGVSDAWLAEKNTKEKRFSLGFFDEQYLKWFPMAVIRKDSKIIAFANVWLGAEKEELSVDLMRYLPGSPPGVMEYLFIQIMLWGKSDGYEWFNFGMTPLSGLEDRALAPIWNRLGTYVFRHGEHFYNFQGLRQYKDKFNPHWQPKYIACPGGLSLPRILLNIASLVSGGLKGTIAK